MERPTPVSCEKPYYLVWLVGPIINRKILCLQRLMIDSMQLVARVINRADSSKHTLCLGEFTEIELPKPFKSALPPALSRMARGQR